MAGMESLSDKELTDLLKSGDRAAFAEIYHRYKHLLLRHAYKKLGDREAVEDILQELFVHLWEQKETLTINGNLAGYLYTAIRNRVFNEFYRSQRKSLHFVSLAEFMDKGEYSTDLTVLENELNAIIDREISQLPPRMGQVLRLSRLDGMSHKEIAEELGIAESTVSNQVGTALRQLKVKLGPLFILAVFLDRL